MFRNPNKQKKVININKYNTPQYSLNIKPNSSRNYDNKITTRLGSILFWNDINVFITTWSVSFNNQNY